MLNNIVGQKYEITHMEIYLTSNPTILNEARGYLDGLVLSDGHIPPIKRNGIGLYRQRCKHKGWLDKIDDDLYEYGIECNIDNGRLQIGSFSPKGGSIAFNLWTRSYVEFKKMRDRFYIKWYDIDDYPKTRWHEDEDSKGDWYIWQKIVPEDIRLTPACVANWYLGDGSISKQTHGNSYYITLSTDDFLREDTIFLTDLLYEVLDIKCGINKNGKIKIFTQFDVSTFLNYIKAYKVECYDYKFPEKLIDTIGD